MNPVQYTRLAFYLYLYIVPATVALAQPHHWLRAVALAGLGPGLWRSLRRASRRGHWDAREAMFLGLTTAALSLVVASVSSLLGWVSFPCWALVALDQTHRREGRRRLAVIQ